MSSEKKNGKGSLPSEHEPVDSNIPLSSLKAKPFVDILDKRIPGEFLRICPCSF